MQGSSSVIELMKILAFSLALMLSFVGYSTFGVPLVVPAPPPVEVKITGAITEEQYIAMGDKIFHGKGTCTLCHKAVGGRAPDLSTVGGRAEKRIKDSSYKGKATTGTEYIQESMLEPSAFVVSGFGKPGTNDTVSPMPVISKGAIGLNEVERNSVVAYLQNWAGMDVGVPLPTGEADVPAEEDAPEVTYAENAQEAFNKFECVMCHVVPGVEEGGDIGPSLVALIGKLKGKKPAKARAYVYESITDPNAVIVKGFDEDTMPDDFASRMTIAELNLIIDALAGGK